ncbi:MAG: hypothetical protein UU58_C0001G0014 [Candidatus Nomurabacteria bacterium GW2011_GWA2_41_25]|uniref:Uncharacterized protein n=1 Tax=Candidatus Nomurabacteria bacterium GW2011_GWA2_41_25 TaxID=1618736 RepID=A0A0G0VWJ0_9BACT|nr:MAG: hypothetical protein UU58_C0001G0014 [Candidatus Nomurabacteria bacterium GW2011_GWA2_41_25]OGI66949.1 MAG: hypothetical protein A2823_02505 [Candidatus Nomurabacteria bacterium RIFCSPHIGHO2_01_FULL_41_91]OGI80428.1 MAG: hypothetical protein A3D43_00125 [Candidatus Nomurabacteria bacterium RIFCSPHIGHO2_02_FULL_41_52]OGI94053.1 MAG: hypothetical protein A3A07_01930 [Candidatus Nomurabacteria bacterium RIFCSPLOWO2_01_FULL_41_52]
MENKQIIVLIGVIFLAFIGYKIISSNIQENKEKAVLQEKAQLQALEKEPLNKCIDDIETAVELNIKYNTVLSYTIFSESYRSCLKPSDGIGHGRIVEDLIASGKMTIEEYCAPPTPQEVEAERQKIHKEEQLAKEECYKRYK